MTILQQAKRFLIGKPIATKHAHRERLPWWFGLPIFSADAISSVAYSTEEILLVLAMSPAALAVYWYINPISIALGVLLILIAFSYYQTIHAYPEGGGTYLVSSENLGSGAGRVAGAALLIDYVLTVAVSISSGAAAIYSAIPSMRPFAVHIAALAVLVITIANLRGARESGILFAVPVYTFIGTVILMVGIAVFQGIGAPAKPIDPASLEHFEKHSELVGLFLVLRAFAASCTALTGTEAIADRVQAFKPPEAKNASLTLAVMVALMLVLSIGMSWAAYHNGIVPMSKTDPAVLSGNKPYLTVMAQLGLNIFTSAPALFYLLQASTAAILFLAANTAFADFPRLSSFLARDKFLPRQLMTLGDKLVFQNGILLLAVLALSLILGFHADVHALIPLYALGVFISFTLSQAGMTVKWHRSARAAGKNPAFNWKMYVSAVGAAVTFAVAVILLWTKWNEHAYLIVFAILALLVLFHKIRKYYDYLARIFDIAPTDQVRDIKSRVILLIPRLHKGTVEAISYAKIVAKDCRALHVTIDAKSAEPLKQFWDKEQIDMPLVISESPYRSLVEPVVEYIDQTIAEDPEAIITVIVPQGVPPKWYQAFLHSNQATLLKLALSNKRNVLITNVRYLL